MVALYQCNLKRKGLLVHASVETESGYYWYQGEIRHLCTKTQCLLFTYMSGLLPKCWLYALFVTNIGIIKESHTPMESRKYSSPWLLSKMSGKKKRKKEVSYLIFQKLFT